MAWAWRAGMRSLVGIAAAVVCSLASNSAEAADIWLHKTGEYQREIVLEGSIVAGDFQKLSRVLKDVGPFADTVWLYSGGGDAYEAMRIGDLLRALEITTKSPERDYVYDDPSSSSPGRYVEDCSERAYVVLPKNQENCVCASACALIWVAGISRQNAMLRIHRPRLSDQSFARLTTNEAERLYTLMNKDVESYLRKYGVPQAVIEKMRSTPSYDLKVYPADEIAGYAPFFDELLAARCGTMTPAEARRLSNLGFRVRNRPATISESERDEFAALDARNRTIRFCETEQKITSRIAAFTKYFDIPYIEKTKPD